MRNKIGPSIMARSPYCEPLIRGLIVWPRLRLRLRGFELIRGHWWSAVALLPTCLAIKQNWPSRRSGGHFRDWEANYPTDFFAAHNLLIRRSAIPLKHRVRIAKNSAPISELQKCKTGIPLRRATSIWSIALNAHVARIFCIHIHAHTRLRHHWFSNRLHDLGRRNGFV